MSQQIQYTQPTQIMAVSECKSIETKYGVKDKFSFKDADNNWYDSWKSDERSQIVAYKESGDKVIIGYKVRYWNDKEQRGMVTIGVVESSEKPSEARSETINKDDAIARAVALKAAVELASPGQDIGQTLTRAETFLAWLKNEQVSTLGLEPLVGSQEERVPTVHIPEDDVDLDSIPF